MENVLSVFSERLKEQMLEKNVTVADIHERLQLDISLIYTYLRGEKFPSMSTAVKLSDFLECSIDFLVGRSDNNETIEFVLTESFSERLVKLMNDRKISGYKLCESVELSRSSVHYWRKGKFEPLLDSIVKLADHFDISVDYLIGRGKYVG